MKLAPNLFRILQCCFYFQLATYHYRMLDANNHVPIQPSCPYLKAKRRRYFKKQFG